MLLTRAAMREGMTLGARFADGSQRAFLAPLRSLVLYFSLLSCLPLSTSSLAWPPTPSPLALLPLILSVSQISRRNASIESRSQRHYTHGTCHTQRVERETRVREGEREDDDGARVRQERATAFPSLAVPFGRRTNREKERAKRWLGFRHERQA